LPSLNFSILVVGELTLTPSSTLIYGAAVWFADISINDCLSVGKRGYIDHVFAV